MLARSRLNRADLVRSLAGGETLSATVADMLGFDRIARPAPAAPALPPAPAPVALGPAAPEPEPLGAIAFDDIPFWRIEKCRPRAAPNPTPEEPPAFAPVPDDPRDSPPVPFEPLAPLTTVLSRLRRRTELHRAGHAVDVEQLVRAVSRGELPDELPRRQRRAWGTRLHVVTDLSRRLIPYRIDQGLLGYELKRLLTRTEMTLADLPDGADEPVLCWPTARGEWSPQAGESVLVLGDLGTLEQQGTAEQAFWESLGRHLTDRDVRCLALVPCRAEAVPARLARWWHVVPWEAAGPGAVSLRDAAPSCGASRPRVGPLDADRLLALLSFAVQIEPQLVRRVRRFLGGTDPGLEARVWQHPALAGDNLCGAVLEGEERRKLLLRAAEEPADLRRAVVDLVRAAHAAAYEALWHAEVVNLGAAAANLASAAELGAAQHWFAETARSAESPATPLADERLDFYCRLQPYFGPEAPQVAPALNTLWRHVFGASPFSQPPDGFDPRWLITPGSEPRNVSVRQRGARLTVGPCSHHAPRDEPRTIDAGLQKAHHAERDGYEAERREPPGAGSPLGPVRLRGQRLRLDDPDPDADFWPAGRRPAWVQRYGRDRFGRWADFRIADVTQRLRWIPPGTFRMGSPEDEPGRWDDEGPQHDVTISHGFWLFDTPCTQALWMAVMDGANPSRFRSPTRPVEQVSWNDCQQFTERLNARLPEFVSGLPTEAEWEYACRAGTTTATYAGPIEILGAHNAPILDSIAWYGGNSGVDFELDNGWDVTGWSEKQYDAKSAGTHAVGKKSPNPWGLFDMLGNVWEWCFDEQRTFTSKAVNDPGRDAEASAAAGSRRVVRGGSWRAFARRVRAACRDWLAPALARDHLGFRCRVQAGSSQAEQEQEKGSVASGERTGARAEPGGGREPRAERRRKSAGS